MVLTAEVLFRFAENHSVIIQLMDIQPDPHQFTRDAWEANAEIWDARMGDEGNDFFNMDC